MKKVMTIIAAVLMSAYTFAANDSKQTSQADTVRVDVTKITKMVTDTTLTTKGNQSIKYYVVFDNTLVKSNKSSYEQYKLARKFGTKISAVIITKGTNKKIIIL